MNPKSDNFESERESVSDQRLDELLSLATPQLDPAQQARLRTFVVEQLVNPTNARNWPGQAWVGSGLAAAAVLVFIGVIWSRTSNRQEVVSLPATELRSIDVNELPVATDASMNEPSVKLNSKKFQPLPPIISRVVTKSNHRLSARAARQNDSKPLEKIRQQLSRQIRPQVERAIVSLAESPMLLASVEPWAERLPLATRQSCESFLVTQSRSSDSRLATAAFRLLCHCGTKQTLSMLMQHASHPQLRSDVFKAFLRNADSQLLAEQANSIPLTDQDKFLRPILSRLLARGDERSIDLFLQVVIKNRWYELAQSCGSFANGSAIDCLLNRLGSNRLSVARAAAVTLSTAPDPAITIELIRVCETPRYRQAAWMALTIRQDEIATAFVAAAAQDLRRVATVVSAKRQWEQLAVN